MNKNILLENLKEDKTFQKLIENLTEEEREKVYQSLEEDIFPALNEFGKAISLLK